MEKIDFDVKGERAVAVHYPGEERCVVMAHGFGAVKEGLIPYAERFAEEFGVILFDYRHFGESEGEPRQLISIRKQLEDWKYAVDLARALGYTKIGLWGTSFSGGHVLKTASEMSVDGVVSQVPFVDGLAVAKAAGMKNLLLLTLNGLFDVFLSLFGRAHYIPIVAPEGVTAFMSGRESMKYMEIIPEGTNWANVAPARTSLSVASYRPIKVVDRIKCPVLYVIALEDRITPPNSALKAAEKTRDAEVVTLHCDHFDVYLDLFEYCVEMEMKFLKRTLSQV